jgi:hypothetical protein
MKSSIISLLTISVFTLNSCNSQNKGNKIKDNKKEIQAIEQYTGTWLFLEKRNNEYVYCTDVSKSITVNKTSIIDHTPMEDSEFRIDHLMQKDNLIYIYLDKKETSFYRFKWINKEKGIAKWILDNYDGDAYINKLHLNNVKKAKCEEEDKPKGLQCKIKNLSKIYDFKISGTDFENKDKNTNPLIAEISIIQKSDPTKIQKIRFEPSSWVMFTDVPCDAISYFKNEKNIKESIDNHHNFIIADYNFDGLEDFAYIWDTGGNGGALYSFYFQDNKGDFLEAEDFPMQNGPFPTELNTISKTITISGPIGCCKINKTVYQLGKNNKWKMISTKQEDIK